MDKKDLLDSTYNSAQCYVAAWMEVEFGEQWIPLYIWLSPFNVHLKLSQYCQLAVSQYKIKRLKKIKLQTITAGEDVEKRESYGTVSGNIN